jgi:orotidine-5'-phosphate decarboxylase
MKRPLSITDRLIVGVDFDPRRKNNHQSCVDWIQDEVIGLADNLQSTKVCLKIESALRACPNLVKEIHYKNLRTFADFKLYGTPAKLSQDGAYLREVRPAFVTVACSAGEKALQALKAELPETEVLGVTVLTSFSDNDAEDVYGRGVDEAVFDLAHLAARSGIDGLICSAREICLLREEFGDRFTLNTPAIRAPWMNIPADDQNQARTMTPQEAIGAGADRIIVERAVTQSMDPYATVMRILDDLAKVV